MATDPVCKMTIDDKSAAGKSRSTSRKERGLTARSAATASSAGLSSVLECVCTSGQRPKRGVRRVKRMKAGARQGCGKSGSTRGRSHGTRSSIRGFAEKARFLAVSRLAQGVLFGPSL